MGDLAHHCKQVERENLSIIYNRSPAAQRLAKRRRGGQAHGREQSFYQC
jgi:hypothetical protein